MDRIEEAPVSSQTTLSAWSRSLQCTIFPKIPRRPPGGRLGQEPNQPENDSPGDDITPRGAFVNRAIRRTLRVTPAERLERNELSQIPGQGEASFIEIAVDLIE